MGMAAEEQQITARSVVSGDTPLTVRILVFALVRRGWGMYPSIQEYTSGGGDGRVSMGGGVIGLAGVRCREKRLVCWRASWFRSWVVLPEVTARRRQPTSSKEGAKKKLSSGVESGTCSERGERHTTRHE